MKRTMQRKLLSLAAVLEGLTGVAFVLVPGAAAAALLGADPNREGLMLGRVMGVALLSLAVACWGASADPGGAARTGTLRAITLYNAGAGVLLTMLAATGQVAGPVAGVVAVLHLGLAAAFAASLWRSEAGPSISAR